MYKDCFLRNNGSVDDAAKEFDMSISTFRKRLDEQLLADGLTIKEYKKQNLVLACKNQKLMDTQRIERKELRGDARKVNTLEALGEEIVKELKNHKIKFKKHKKAKQSAAVGVIQVSDTHFNEVIDTPFNKYNWEIASRRLRKHVMRSLDLFKVDKTKTVVFAFTGDLINSDRRLDELLTNATNRAQAVLHVVDILAQCIKEVYEKGFDVTFTYCIGNESRIDFDMGNVEILGKNNFDYMIMEMLDRVLPEYITFVRPQSVYASVLNIKGKNILVTHGISIKKNPEQSINMIVANYCREDIKVDYAIFGHIHSALISEWYARSGSLSGSNGYSVNNLNLHSRASQNCYIVTDEGITCIRNDLQDTENFEGYKLTRELEVYTRKEETSNVVISQTIC